MRAPKTPRAQRSLRSRAALILAGVAMVALGTALLVGGHVVHGPNGAGRLFRVEGILIVLGLVLVGAGLLNF